MELKKFLEDKCVDSNLIEVFHAIEAGSKVVQSEVSRAGLGADIYGAKGSENIQGEEQQKLDVKIWFLRNLERVVRCFVMQKLRN